MSARSKGNAYEREVQVSLEKLGYLVHRAYASFVRLPSGKAFVRSHDIFGTFDLVALDPIGSLRFLQITTESGATERRKKLEAFFLQWGGHVDATFELVVRYPGNRRGKRIAKRWRLQRITKDKAGNLRWLEIPSTGTEGVAW